MPTHIPLTMQPPRGMQLKTSSLFLQAANREALLWCQSMVRQHHYLGTGVSPKSMPMAYLVLQQRERELKRIGCLIFNHTQCSFVRGWFGSRERVQQGEAYLTQWELINLARVWASDEIQRTESPYYVSNAASRVISAALKHVVRDFLLIYPPAFFDQPWRLRECLTYLHSTRFKGTIYKANNFVYRRDDGHGLVTYSRTLRTLRWQEEELIREASRLHEKNKKRRARKRFLEEVSWSPFLRLYPVPDAIETPGAAAAA